APAPAERISCVLVDEGQFLKKHHVLELTEIVDGYDIPVMVYGLKNDFRNELFEGSKYLLIYADKIEEIKTICWCGRKATMVARVVDGKFVKTGDQILVGGNDMYVSLCRRHYNDGRLGEENTRPRMVR
ncbi:MAG: thymidine kinase, partial [Clostridiales Family XIII bacterium]|nr:thymidine kinase [Clostridiales Family XIII bacterium]